MNIEIPPIPTIYNMVNLDGFDLATANGVRVPGIYDKVYDAMSEDKIEIFYNWKFADVILPPSYVEIDDSVAGEIVVNGEILITSADSVSIIGISRPPVINSLLVTENGTYTVETGVDGFSPVVVQVPGPVLGTLNATQNGTYTPPTGQDGFSEVVVDVPDPPPPVLVSLNVTENGDYLPGTDEDGFSEVHVAVPAPPKDNPNLLTNWYFIGGGSQQGGEQFPINQRGQTTYSAGDKTKTICCWLSQYAPMTIQSDGIVITKNALSNGQFICQKIYNKALIGKTLTFSVFCDLTLYGKAFQLQVTADGTWIDMQKNFNDNGVQLCAYTFVCPSFTDALYLRLNFEAGTTALPTAKLFAAKLELGDVSTLCQEENDTLILSDVPDYMQELMKCYKVHYRISLNSTYAIIPGSGLTGTSTNTYRFAIMTPVPMLGTIVGTASDLNIYTIKSGVETYDAINNISWVLQNGNVIRIAMTSNSAHTSNDEINSLRNGNSTTAYLDFSSE